MWISNIKLKNFRPFYGKDNPVEITFDNTTKDGFVIIEAKSDVGKTTFLSAMVWCLYGEETIDIGLNDTEKGLLNPFCIERMYEMKEGETDDIEVEITLNDSSDDDIQYIIKRSARVQKVADGVEMDGDSSLVITEWEDDDARKIPEYSKKNVINSILPRDIHLFFMFEGEKLEKHFSFTDNDNIQHAIERTSQIKQIKTAIKHLRQVRDTIWTSGSNKVDKELEALQSKIKDGDDYIQENEDRIREKKKDIQEAERRIGEIDEFLQSHNVASIREQSSRQKHLEDENSHLEADIKTIKKDIYEKVMSKAPNALMIDAAGKLLDILQKEREKSKLEPNINGKYLKDILNQKKCVCGRSLDDSKKEDEEAINLLRMKLEENKLDEMREILTEGRFCLEGITKSITEEFVRDIEEMWSSIQEKEERIAANTKIIDDIIENLKETDEDKVLGYVKERKDLENHLDKEKQSVTRLETAVSFKKTEVGDARKKTDSIGKKKKGNDKKVKTAEFLDRALRALESIEAEILATVRLKVEKRTWEYFSTLHWDKEKYRKLSIDEAYNLKLMDEKGTDWTYNLASGPKQLLLLSFIAALSEISGFSFPVFVDTPFANIDNEQRENVATRLPGYLKGKQVILLMKDQEYTPKIKGLMKERISDDKKFIRVNNTTGVR